MRTQTSFDTIHSYFAWDHQRLQDALDRVLRLLDEGQWERAERAFHHYDRGMRRHIRIEEDIAFQLYAFDRTGSAKAPTQSMQRDHAEISIDLEKMQAALVARQDAPFRAAYARLGAILPEHNANEERNVYPLLDALIGSAEAERLVARLRAHPASTPR